MIINEYNYKTRDTEVYDLCVDDQVVFSDGLIGTIVSIKVNPRDGISRRIKYRMRSGDIRTIEYKDGDYSEERIQVNMNEAADIKAKNPGILEVPAGKKVTDLPVSHFKSLIDKIGRNKVIRALTNLEIWNKNDNPKLSKWAVRMKDSIGDYGS